MNKFTAWLIQFITACINVLFPFQKSIVTKPKPTPPKNVAKGLFSMNLHVKDQVNKLFSNPMIMGTLKGTVDIGKQFNLSFPCLLHLNSDQKFSLALVDNGIRLTFNDTCPVLEAQMIFDMQMDIDFIFVDRDHCRISLVGAPDYIVWFI